MGKLAAIYRKELQHYFQSITAYVMIGSFLALSGYFFFSVFRYYNYLSYQAGREPYLADNLNLIEGVMRPLMGNVSVVLLFILPLLTMRLLAEEKKQGTFELLLTYPLSDFAAVMGKYLAALTVFAVMIAGTLLYPAMLAIFSNPEPGPSSRATSASFSWVRASSRSASSSPRSRAARSLLARRPSAYPCSFSSSDGRPRSRGPSSRRSSRNSRSSSTTIPFRKGLSICRTSPIMSSSRRSFSS